MTIREAFASYELEKLRYKGKSSKTIKNYETALSSFLKSNTDIPVQLLAYEHIVRWQMQMDRDGNAVSYVSSNMGRMRKVLKYLKGRGISSLDPDQIEPPAVKRKEVVFLYADEVQAMINAAESPRDKALLSLTFSSGARISEILQLNRDSIVDGEAEIIGKGDKPGKIRFDPTALRYLAEYLEGRKDRLRPLFVSGQYRRLSYARANQIFHMAADYAGIDKNVSTHIYRHSFATDLLINGAHIMEIKEHLRHEDVSTTMRYLHINDARLKESHEKHHTVLK